MSESRICVAVPGTSTKNGERLVPPFALNQLNAVVSACSVETSGEVGVALMAGPW
jgi:hypothetical protein